MTTEDDKRQTAAKWIKIIPMVICLLVIVFLAIIIFSKGKSTRPAVQQINEKILEGNQAEATPGQNKSQDNESENKKIAEGESIISEEEIERIKTDIVLGKREDVPPEMKTSARIIIREYLYNCYMIKELDEKIGCYELYFLNKDANLMQMKNGCLAMTGDERTECLDQYYYYMGSWERAIFCEAISDPGLRSECISSVV